MSKPTNRLGRGLSALIPSAPTPRPAQPDVAGGVVVREIPLDQIAQNPRQPRSTFHDATLQELAESIRTRGVLQPVIVRPATGGQYELVAGERRLRAAKLANLTTIPAVIHELADPDALEIALVENLQREDLAPLERAAAYQQYLDTFGGTIDDLAAKLSESRANVSNYLRLLKLRPEICYMLGSGDLAMGQARAIAAIDDPERQLAIAKLAVRRNLSVRQVEELARAGSESAEQRAVAERPRVEDRNRENVAQELSRVTGLRVRLLAGRKKNSGRVVISYNSLEEFDALAKRLTGASDLA
jgi:ParB family transcriptional regulator, chromosome partitioning protein